MEQAVIVTGAGRGIGKAIALAFARQGARLVLAARSERELEQAAREVREAGGAALAVPADLTRPEDVQRVVTACIEAYGRVDVLVNNAGGAGATAGVTDLALSDWHAVLDSNLTSAFLGTQAVVPHMARQGSGRIINFSSVAGKNGLPFRAGYCAAKAGIVGFTRAMARELGPLNITVNSVVPGAIEGERLDTVIRLQAEKRGLAPDAVAEEFRRNSPLNRTIPPEDVAAVVLWLAGPHGGSITGEDVNVTAGAVMY